MSSPSSLDYSTASQHATVFPILSATTKIEGKMKTRDNTLTSDDKFTVVLSVTAVFSVVIILSIVITKLRCGTKDTIIYNINRSSRQGPTSIQDQFQVPFRNLETDIYMEVEEIDDGEIDEICNQGFGKFQNHEREAIKGLKFDSLSKPKPDSLRSMERSFSRTDRDDSFEQKLDSIKPVEKPFKKYEKYRTFTTRRLLIDKVNLTRQNSWHNLVEAPNQNEYLQRAKSCADIHNDKTFTM